MIIITIKDCLDHSGYTNGTIPKGVWVKLLSVYTNFYGRFIDVQYCGERYALRDGEFVVEWDKNDFNGAHTLVKCRCGHIIKTAANHIRTIPYDYNLTQYWDILKRMKDVAEESRFDPKYKVTCSECYSEIPVTYNMKSYGALSDRVIVCNSAITDDMWKEYRNNLETTLRGIGYYV